NRSPGEGDRPQPGRGPGRRARRDDGGAQRRRATPGARDRGRMTALNALERVQRELEMRGVPSPAVDARLLLCSALDIAPAELYGSLDRELGVEERDRLRTVLVRRSRREPLAYILGEWGFRRLTLELDTGVLVPRPETEIVVERCLSLIAGMPAPRILDAGTGSGAIALAIADEHPGADVLAVDSSARALAVAERN